MKFAAAGQPMVDLDLELAYEHQLPMAIEYVTRNAVRKPLQIRIDRGSLKSIIAAIVGAVPGYHVDFSQGLVDIYSPEARLNPTNPLNVLVSKFVVTDADTHFADAELLCTVARQLNPHSGCGGSIAGGQWGSLKITLSMRNSRVYEILNAIVAQNGQAVWTPIRTLNKPAMLGPNVTTNFWYIYPLTPPFERIALARLRGLFPNTTQKTGSKRGPVVQVRGFLRSTVHKPQTRKTRV